MTHRLRRSVSGALAAGFTLAAGALAWSDERAELMAVFGERQKVELQIELLKRALPPAFEAVDEVHALRARAAAAGLGELKVEPLPGRERVPLEDGRPSPVERYRIALSGRGPPGAVESFLRLLSDAPRAHQVETLQLSAEPGDTLALTLRLGLPVYTGAVEGGPPPAADEDILAVLARQKALEEDGRARRESLTGRSRDEQRAAIEAEAEDARRRYLLQQLLAARVALLELRLVQRTLARLVEAPGSGHLLGALADFGEAVRGQALALTAVRVADTVLLEGVAVGAAARAASRPALEKAGFEVRELRELPTGACRPFSITAALLPGARASQALLPKELFRHQAASVCVAGRGPSAAPVFTAGPPANRLVLRLRQMDLADVFFVLNDYLSASFVLDADVSGRLSLDVGAGAGVDETLAAAGAAAGISIGPGPLRRVSVRAAPPATALPRARGTAAPVSLSFRRADVRQVLGIFGEVSGLPVHVPPELRCRISVFARDRPWDEVLHALVAATGSTAVIEEERIVVAAPASSGGEAAPRDACASQAGEDAASWAPRLTPERLSAEDLSLAGLAQAGGTWKAYAYDPLRRLVLLEPGQELYRSRVASVDSAGITVETAAGMVTLPLRP